MFCSKCGSKLGSDDKFCMKCGEKIDHADEIVLATQTEGTQEDDGVEWDGSGLFCAKCGAEAAQTDIVCRFCESKLVPKRMADEADMTEENDETDYDVGAGEDAYSETTENAGASSWKRLIRLGLALVLMFFFFPFTMVSCQGEDVTFSGVEMMTATPMQEDVELDEEYPPNAYLLIAFGAGAVALIMSLFAKQGNKAMLGAGVFSVSSALFLFIFRSTFMQYYQLKEYSNYIQVEFLWGWYLCFIIYLVLAAVAFYEHSQNNRV